MQYLFMMKYVLCLLIINGYVMCAEKLSQQPETTDVSEGLKLFREYVKDMQEKGDLLADDCDCCNETLQADVAKTTVKNQMIITYTYNSFTGRPEGRSVDRRLIHPSCACDCKKK